MEKNFKKLINETRNSVRNLRNQWQKKLQELKTLKQSEEIPKEYQPISHKKPEKTVVEISPLSVAKATAIIILLYALTQFIYEIRAILLVFFISLLFSAALDPTVDRLEKRRIPRGISIIFIYLMIFVIIGIFISNFIPIVSEQIIELSKGVGELINNITTNEKNDITLINKIKPYITQFLESADRQTLIEGAQTALEKLGAQLNSIAGNAWNALKVIFNGVFNVIMVLVITFFMTIDERGIEKFLKSLFPENREKYIIAKTKAIKEKIGAWVRGQMILSLTIGVVVTIALLFLGVEYAATLGMIAAICEFIPYIGSSIAAIPALLIAFNEYPMLAFWVLITYIVIQQFENQILVPVVMKQAVGLSPVIVMLSVLIGAKFLGIMGVILAVPVTTIVWIFVRDYTRES